ncbi:MAG: HAMP domain-containing sensor histidine kinase, partial [Verrucomicrobiota bacterium]
VVVLSGFGAVSYLFLRNNLYNEVEEELQRGLSALASGVKSEKPGGEIRLSEPALLLRVPRDQEQRFAPDNEHSFYFAVWIDGQIARKSSSPLAEDLPVPQWKSGTDRITVRTRGKLREHIAFSSGRANKLFGELKSPSAGKGTRPGELPRAIVLVGCSLENVDSELRKLGSLLAVSGVVIFAMGTSIGWLFSGQAIKSIGTISDAAKEIAAGDSSLRIDLQDTDSELGELASVLNESFDRLRDSQSRQAQFTADASHELRTPAFVVLSQAQLALRNKELSEENREAFQVCESAAVQMKELIESLLVLARQDSGAQSEVRETCQLDKIAGEAVDLLQPLASKKGVTVRTELKPVEVTGDPSLLRQVVANLVNNAIEYIKPSDEVRISVDQDSESSVLLTVADNGPGISPENLPRLFDRFYRADQSRSGQNGHTGLGLAICKVIVEAHQGEISVSSELGSGATFSVNLPA